jgi:L-rhamnose mutarotase
MRVVFLYRPHTEQEGKVLDYVHEYKMRHQDVEPELVSLDTREGDDMAKLYGVYSYPAILAISHDGSMRQMWQDEQLPLMNELDAYATAY